MADERTRKVVISHQTLMANYNSKFAQLWLSPTKNLESTGAESNYACIQTS